MAEILPEDNLYVMILGVPKDACPPNAYDLLRLTIFERNGTTIHDAGSAQLAKLEAYADQKDPEAAERVKALVDEVCEACTKLSIPDRRVVYDAELRETLGMEGESIAPHAALDSPPTPVRCPNCQAENSTLATRCIECGASLTPPNKLQVIWLGLSPQAKRAAVVGAAVGLLVFLIAFLALLRSLAPKPGVEISGDRGFSEFWQTTLHDSELWRIYVGYVADAPGAQRPYLVLKIRRKGGTVKIRVRNPQTREWLYEGEESGPGAKGTITKTLRNCGKALLVQELIKDAEFADAFCRKLPKRTGTTMVDCLQILAEAARGGADVGGTLEEQALKAPIPAVRLAALDALLSIPAEPAERLRYMEPLCFAAQDTDRSVRERALQVMKELGLDGVTTLARFLEEGSDELRSAACHTLIALDMHALPAIPALAGLLAHPGKELCGLALQALDQLQVKNDTILNALRALGDNQDADLANREVAEWLRRRLSKIRDGGVIDVTGLDMRMVPIRAGTFRMGPRMGEKGAAPGRTERDITLTKPLYIGACELSQRDYQTLIGRNPGSPRNRSLPVNNVDWYDAVTFCRKLTERERKAGRLPDFLAYRLPTEAEWEYCCRAGTLTAYHSGDSVPDLQNRTWYRVNSRDVPHENEKKPANPWGIYEMLGNLKEWCLDRVDCAEDGRPMPPDPSYQTATDPFASVGSHNVSRGGSWASSAAECRAAVRSAVHPWAKSDTCGFRLVLAPIVHLNYEAFLDACDGRTLRLEAVPGRPATAEQPQGCYLVATRIADADEVAPERFLQRYGKLVSGEELALTAVTDGTVVEPSESQVFAFHVTGLARLRWTGKTDDGDVAVSVWNGLEYDHRSFKEATDFRTFSVVVNRPVKGDRIFVRVTSPTGNVHTDRIVCEKL